MLGRRVDRQSGKASGRAQRRFGDVTAGCRHRPRYHDAIASQVGKPCAGAQQDGGARKVAEVAVCAGRVAGHCSVRIGIRMCIMCMHVGISQLLLYDVRLHGVVTQRHRASPGRLQPDAAGNQYKQKGAQALHGNDCGGSVVIAVQAWQV
jgi:hypothetical protein